MNTLQNLAVHHSYSGKLLTGAALIYLALPNMLFALGWLKPVPALLAVGLILLMVVRLTGQSLPISVSETRGNRIWVALLLAMLAGGWVVSTGMTGHVFQTSDYLVRNALFATLVRCDWPLVLPDQFDYVYYLASWLPPALAARIHPSGAFPLFCVGAWCFLGILIMGLLMQKIMGAKSLLFLLILMATGCVGNWLFLYDKNLMINRPDFYYFLSNGSSVQLQMTFHHVIPIWVVLALYFSGALSWYRAVCSASFVLLCSPLGGIGLAAFFLFALMADGRKAKENMAALFCEPVFYCGCLLATVAALFFSSSTEGSSFYWVWERLPLHSSSQVGKAFFWAFCTGGSTICLIILMAWVMKHLHNCLVWFVVGMLILLPFFIIGVGYNELLFKASSVPYWILSFLLTQWMIQANWIKRAGIVTFIMLTAGGCCQLLVLCYRSMQKPHQSKLQTWDWHLYHPEHVWYSRFRGKVKNFYLFHTEAGASSQTLLAWSRRNNRSDRELLPPPSPWTGCETTWAQPKHSGGGHKAENRENSPKSAL